MSALTDRQPVVHRGRRVPGLFSRVNAAGQVIFEARAKLNGRSLRRTLVATNVADAITEAEDWRSSLRAGAPTAQSRRSGATFADVFDLYVQRLRDEQRSPRTIETALWRGKHLSSLASKPVASLATTDAVQLITALKAKKLSPFTVRGCFSVASAVMSEATILGLVPANTFRPAAARLPETADRSGGERRLDAAEVDRLIAGATDGTRCLVATLALSGCRVSEALALRWRDVDCATGELLITEQLGGDGRRRKLKTKASQRRIVVAGLAPHLRAHRVRQLEAGHASPDSYVFATASGKPSDRRRGHLIVQNAARKAGLIAKDGSETLRVHDLRGSAALRSVEGGMPVSTLMAAYGWSSSAIALDVYAKHRDNTQTAVAV